MAACIHSDVWCRRWCALCLYVRVCVCHSQRELGREAESLATEQACGSRRGTARAKVTLNFQATSLASKARRRNFDHARTREVGASQVGLLQVQLLCGLCELFSETAADLAGPHAAHVSTPNQWTRCWPALRHDEPKINLCTQRRRGQART